MDKLGITLSMPSQKGVIIFSPYPNHVGMDLDMRDGYPAAVLGKINVLNH